MDTRDAQRPIVSAIDENEVIEWKHLDTDKPGLGHLLWTWKYGNIGHTTALNVKFTERIELPDIATPQPASPAKQVKSGPIAGQPENVYNCCVRNGSLAE